MQPAYSELYTFYTTSDDGVRLWIDGRLIVDNWTDHPPTENSGTPMEKQDYLMPGYWGNMEATVGHKRAEFPMDSLSRHRRPTLPPAVPN